MIGLPEVGNTIIVFGSMARGDHDLMSDRDILVVDDNRRDLREAANALDARGWSVAQFTWGQIEVLKARRSLFLHHIILEGAVLRDRGQRYNAMISGFEPAASYDDELQTSKHMLDAVRTIPPSNVGRLWAADVMAVAARNMGVSLLAEHRIYKFSLPEICAFLMDRTLIDAGELRILTNLRRLKYLYRNDHFDATVSFRYLKQTSEILDRLLGLGWTIEERPFEMISGENPRLIHPYAFARSIEKKLYTLRPRDTSDQSEFASQLRDCAR